MCKKIKLRLKLKNAGSDRSVRSENIDGTWQEEFIIPRNNKSFSPSTIIVKEEKRAYLRIKYNLDIISIDNNFISLHSVLEIKIAKSKRVHINFKVQHAIIPWFYL